MKKGLHVLPCLLAGAIILLLLYSCASMGSPSGGPRDEDPPRFVLRAIRRLGVSM